MLLKQAVDILIDESVNRESCAAYTRVSHSLEQFMGESRTRTDILSLADMQWIQRYYQFLLNDYVPTDKDGLPIQPQGDQEQQAIGRSNRTDRIVKVFRGMVTKAINNGWFPRIDAFRGIKDYARTSEYKQSVNYNMEVMKLFTGAIREPLSIVDRYMAGLYLCGVELADLNEVLQPLTDKSKTLHLPHLGIERRLDSTLQKKLLALKQSIDPTVATDRASATLTALMERIEAKLYRSESVFTDWLGLMHRDPAISAQDIEDIIKVGIGSGSCPASAKLSSRINAATDALTRRFLREEGQQGKRFWVAIMTAWPETAEKFEDRLFGLNYYSKYGMTELGATLEGFTYCPCRGKYRRVKTASGRTELRHTVDPHRAVMRNTLFACVTPELIRAIREDDPRLYIMRKRNGGGYVKFSYSEICLLRDVLNALGDPDQVELVVDAKRPVGECLERNKQVVLHDPRFEGIVGTIIGIDKDETQERETYYLVEFQLMDKTVKLSISRRLIDPLLSQP